MKSFNVDLKQEFRVVFTNPELAEEYFVGEDSEFASPWFDAGLSDCDFGVEVPTATYWDLIDSESKWFDCLHSAQDKIDKLLGWETSTKLSSFQHVY